MCVVGEPWIFLTEYLHSGHSKYQAANNKVERSSCVAWNSEFPQALRSLTSLSVGQTMSWAGFRGSR